MQLMQRREMIKKSVDIYQRFLYRERRVVNYFIACFLILLKVSLVIPK